jgi:uncharacterized protein (TIGR01244 family)
MKLHRLTDRIAVSGALTEDDLRGLLALGYRTVVDLRSDGEPRPQGIAPWDEASLAREAGLVYHQVPVEPQLLSDALGLAVHRIVSGAPGPVLLHCTTGRRAGTFALALLARTDGLDIEACLARGRAIGLDFEGMPRLTAFLRGFVARHGGKGDGAEGGRRDSGIFP